MTKTIPTSKSSSNSTSPRYGYVLASLGMVLIIAGLFWYNLKSRQSPVSRFIESRFSTLTPAPTTVDAKVNLPSGWQLVDTKIETQPVRAQKDTTDSFKPTVVMLKSSLPADSDPQSYITTLVKGAKSTIPSLKYAVNTIAKDGQTSHFEGTYLSSKTKIAIVQEIIIKDGTVYTLTASYLPKQEVKSDIDSIFVSIKSSYSL
jgi:hypothetical protein